MRINDPNLLQQVVSYLDKHQEAIRIKKMLYCLCTGRWEKDNDYLNSINFQYLIEQIVRENNTLELFMQLLQNLIGTVNKPKKYVDVAKIIYLAIGQLYPEFDQQHRNRNRTVPARVEIVPTPTNYGSGSDLTSPVASAFQRAYAPEPTQLSIVSNGVPSSLQRAYEPLPTQQFEVAASADDVDESAYETYCAPDLDLAEMSNPANTSDVSNDRSIVPEYDPFILRQNVMSYANPLRAKIILLLMLRPDFNFGSQSVTMMREYLLDDLLLEVLTAYPTILLLEESMTGAVGELVEIEEYGKAANGLIQSLIPVYNTKPRG